MGENTDYNLGSSGGVDRLGLHQYQIPVTALSLEECATIARGLSVNGVPERSRTWSQDASGTYTVTILYEGASDPSNFETQYLYALKSSFREEPIEAHPKIKEIKDKYLGYNQGGRIYFPVTIPESQTSTSSQGSRGNKSNSQIKNPFFGVEKYMVLVVTWSRTYSSAAIPGDVLVNVGKVIKAPPGGPPPLPGRDNWLVMPPQASQRGNMFTISEEYQLLEENAPVDLYDTGSGISSK